MTDRQESQHCLPPRLSARCNTAFPEGIPGSTSFQLASTLSHNRKVIRRVRTGSRIEARPGHQTRARRSTGPRVPVLELARNELDAVDTRRSRTPAVCGPTAEAPPRLLRPPTRRGRRRSLRHNCTGHIVSPIATALHRSLPARDVIIICSIHLGSPLRADPPQVILPYRCPTLVSDHRST